MTLLKRSKKSFKKLILFTLFSILLISYHGVSWCDATIAETDFHRAQSLWQQTKWDDAVLAYEEYLNKNPDGSYVAEAYMNLGQYLEGYSRFEEALEFYRAALEKVEGRTAGLVQMESAAANSMKSRMAQILQTEIASVHTKMGNYDQSIGIYRTLLQETGEWDLFKVANRELKTLLRVKAVNERNTRTAGQCGKESLLVILRYYNIAPSAKIISEKLKENNRGISLASIVQAASAHGLKSYGVRVKDNSIDAVQTPAILHLYPDHYVVLVEKLKKEAKIIDALYSKQGERTIAIERLKKMWTGHAVVFNQTEVAKGGVSLLTQKEMKGVFGGHNWWHAGTWSKLGDSEDNTKQVFDDNTNCGGRVGCPAGVLVNTSTLNLVITDTDDIWKGIGETVVLKRTYNADDSSSGMFGNSWHFRYEVFVQENPDTSISLFRGSGKYDIFTSQGGGAYAPPAGTFDKLQKNADGTYTLLIKNTKETYSFGTDGYLNSILDKNGNKIEVLWNTDHHITKIIVYYGASLTKEITFEYNLTGQCSKMVLPDGRFSSFEYDQGKLIKSTDAGGYQTVYAYDQNSYINSFTTPTGTFQIIGSKMSSGFFAPQQVIDPVGNVRNYSTDGSWIVVTDAKGYSTKYLADDNFAYTIDILDANGGTIVYAYDSYGNRTSVTDQNGKVWTMAYDSARGNLTKITDPLGNVVSLTYDTNDNLVSIAAPLGRNAAYQYDAKNNLIKATDALSNSVSLTYDAQGKLTGIALPGSGSYAFTYDTYGNLLSETAPGSHITSFSYDNSGHVTSRTDANGSVVTFQYDALKRMTKASYPDGSLAYDYDCCSLKGITAKDGRKMTFQYDADNRLIEYQDLNNFIIQYGYDKVGNLISLTYPGNKVVTYEYDKVNRLISVTDWLSNVTSYDYDLTGNLTGTTYPDNSWILQQYDNANRLKSILDFKGDATVNAVFNYTLDSLGNRTGITSYQPLNVIPTPANVNYTYDPDNRLLSAGSATFNYNNNGNLIKKTIGSSVTNYTWDYDNMLTQLSSGGNTYTYKYDALGNRIAKIVNSVETRFVVNPSGALSQVLAESDSGGNITAYYVYGLGLITKVTPAGNAYHYHYDGIGSTIAITDSLGNVVNKYAYDAFGKVLSQTETISNPFKYVGRFGVMDDGNGLLYMRARYYDPEVGRFVSKDPIGMVGGINMYLYGKNNPINLIDSNGLYTWPYNWQSWAQLILTYGGAGFVVAEASNPVGWIMLAGGVVWGIYDLWTSPETIRCDLERNGALKNVKEYNLGSLRGLRDSQDPEMQRYFKDITQ